MNRELHNAVCNDPENLALRLVYADWLEEQGDLRAEFVRTQIRLAELEATRPETDAELYSVNDRSRTLLQQHRSYWNGELHRLLIRTSLQNGVGRRQPIRCWRYGRGFVESLVVRGATFAEHAELLRTLGPIRSVRLVAIDEHVDWVRIFEQPLLEQLETFALDLPYVHPVGPLSAEMAKLIANSPAIRQLRQFRVHGYSAALNRFARRIPGFFGDGHVQTRQQGPSSNG